MGIRFEKDTILNWINEMAKFMRLIVARYDAFDEEKESVDIEKGYLEFFKNEKSYFKGMSHSDLEKYADSLEIEQVRPLAQLLMYDGLINKEKDLLEKARFLFEWNMKRTGAFSFEDFEYLSKIDKNL